MLWGWGGAGLPGQIGLGGSKNDSLPILAACTLTAEPVTLRNLAEVTDTSVMIEILTSLGCTVEDDVVTAARVTQPLTSLQDSWAADAVTRAVPDGLAGVVRTALDDPSGVAPPE